MRGWLRVVYAVVRRYRMSGELCMAEYRSSQTLVADEAEDVDSRKPCASQLWRKLVTCGLIAIT